jgi:hypothetical protein
MSQLMGAVEYVGAEQFRQEAYGNLVQHHRYGTIIPLLAAGLYSDRSTGSFERANSRERRETITDDPR